MNLQNIVRVIVVSLVIITSAKVGRSEPHGATSRIPDRSLWSSAGENEYRLGRMVSEANSALVEGQYDLAISRCTTILGQHPDKKLAAMTFELRSEAYATKHQYQQSLVDAESAIKTDPSSPLGYIARGVLHYRLEKYKPALVDFNEAVRLNPNNPDAYLQRGTCYQLMGDAEHAMADYTQAIKLNLRRGGAHMNRAGLFLHKRDYRAALADLNVALRRGQNLEHPLYIAALNAIAWMKAVCPDASFRDGKKAVELGTKACELSKWSSPVYLDTLAAAYAECSDFDQAIKNETQALRTVDSDPDETEKEKRFYAEQRQEHLRLFRDHKPVRDEFSRIN